MALDEKEKGFEYVWVKWPAVHIVGRMLEWFIICGYGMGVEERVARVS